MRDAGARSRVCDPPPLTSGRASCSGYVADEELLNNLILGLAKLNSDPGWSEPVRDVLREMIAGDREASLQRLWAILRTLAENGHLDEDAAQRAIAACNVHWVVMRVRVLELLEAQREAMLANAAQPRPKPSVP